LVDGFLVGRDYTDNSGRAYISYLVNIPVGFHNISAVYDGDDYYKPSTVSVADGLKVKPAPTQITVPPISGYVDDLITISALLKESKTSNPISGQNILFKVNGVILNGLTDDDGVARVTYKPTQEDKYVIQASFTGSINYLDAQGEGDMVVKKHPTTIKLNPASAEKWHNVIFKAYFTSDGNPVKDKMVNFYVDGNLVGSSPTDEEGISSLVHMLQIPYGTYPITASFAGDRIYESSENDNSLEVLIPQYPNVLQVVNQGGGLVYIVYNVQMIKLDGQVSKVALGGYIKPGSTLNFDLGVLYAGTKISIEPFVYDRSGMRITELNLLNRIIVDGELWYEKEFRQAVDNSGYNPATPVYPINTVIPQEVIGTETITESSNLLDFITQILNIFNSDFPGNILQPFLNFFNWLIVAQELLDLSI
jgi:hypothetical protein